MKLVTLILGFLGALFAVVIIFSLPVMWLWNWLMPEIFGLTEITFWQSVGLLILSGILFRSTSNNHE